MPSLQLLWCLATVSRHVAHISNPRGADVFFAVRAFDLRLLFRMFPIKMVLEIAENFIIQFTNGTLEHQFAPLVRYGSVFGQQFDLYHSVRSVGMRSAGFTRKVLLRTELALYRMGSQFVLFELLNRAEAFRALIAIPVLPVDQNVVADGVDGPEPFSTMVTFERFVLVQFAGVFVGFLPVDSSVVTSIGTGVYEGALARFAFHNGAQLIHPMCVVAFVVSFQIERSMKIGTTLGTCEFSFM